MNQDQMKRAAAEAAIDRMRLGSIVGIGTGSTVNQFIDCLADRRDDIEAAVSSSEESTRRLNAIGVEVLELNSTGNIDQYFDGADEVDQHGRCIKGGGGALTREKIIAQASKEFICMVDSSKCVDLLGKFPLPVEVIPMARSLVAREMVKLGGQPELREGFTTDNGNPILDVHSLKILDPVELESTINQLPGVVTVGLFARRKADTVIIADKNGIRVQT